MLETIKKKEEASQNAHESYWYKVHIIGIYLVNEHV
jgi:hypothetical protein